MYFSDDTIIAVATSMASDAGVGIIRVSGPQAQLVAQALCPEFKAEPSRYLHRVEVQDSATKEILDDGLSVYFPKGSSFTGEEVVELQLHGGRHVLRTILQKAIATGLCRMALPGEFSFRAVRNGKLSLREASALQQTIVARSDFEAKVARKQLSKKRDCEIQNIGAEIRELLAKMELSIDFSDQDVEVLSKADLEDALRGLLHKAENLLQALECAKRLAQGLQVVLLGAPNAGKSTLFNAMLAEERAIVSAEAGTTRDVITEDLLIGPYRLRLADTAGVRSTNGFIESEGIEKAKKHAEDADVVLHIIDSLNPEKVALPERFADGAVHLTVFTKSDLATVKEDPSSVSVSAKTGQGIPELLSVIRQQLDTNYSKAFSAFLPTEFQWNKIQECRKNLMECQHLVEFKGLNSPELVSASLRSAAKALSDMIGETTPDTVLTQIFSEFCIGK